METWMPTFQVLRRVDAFVEYIAEVDSDSADEATARAYDDETLFKWEQVSVAQFDARSFVALDEDGDEIEATQRGDF